MNSWGDLNADQQIELKLAKVNGIHWPQLLADTSASETHTSGLPLAGLEVAQRPIPLAGGPAKVQGGVDALKKKKNWDQLVAGELMEKEDTSDPVSVSVPAGNGMSKGRGNPGAEACRCGDRGQQAAA